MSKEKRIGKTVKAIVLRWTQTSSQDAESRGWMIFDVGGGVNEVERIDTAEVFRTDDDAMLQVIRDAWGGTSITASRALIYLLATSPKELAARFTRFVDDDLVVPQETDGSLVVMGPHNRADPLPKPCDACDAEETRRVAKRALDAIRMPKYTSKEDRRDVIEELAKLAGEEPNG